MKWVAAADAPKCEPKSLERSMFLDGFTGILRTGRIKAAAVSDKGTDGGLIETK